MHPRDEAAIDTKGAIGFDSTTAPASGGVVTQQYYRYGVEIEIDSMKRDGTKSWVVVSRRIERCVKELALDHTEPTRLDENTLSIGRLVAWKSHSSASSSSQIGAAIPKGQRKWDFKPTIRRVDDSSGTVLGKMTSLLRYRTRTART